MTCTFCKFDACQEHYNQALAKEFENPAYFAVHHLLVPCYHLQHNLYSKVGWLAVREQLRKFVEEDLSPQEALRLNSKIFEGSKHDSLTKSEKFVGVDQIQWNVDIGGVRMDTAEHYCHDIREWARQIIFDTADFIQEI